MIVSFLVGTPDYHLFVDIWNQGIDSRLEAFTKSEYKFRGTMVGNRLIISFHPDEMSILLRRLSEVNTEKADMWIGDILYFYYDKEVW